MPRLHASIAASDADNEWSSSYVSSARDVSAGGFFMRMPWAETAKYPVGTRHRITLFVVGDGAPLPLEIEAQVKRLANDGVGFAWLAADSEVRLAPLLARAAPANANQ